MECKDYCNLQDTIFIWRLQILVCPIELIEYYNERLIHGNSIHSIFIRLNKRICDPVCIIVNVPILEGGIRNRW